MKQILQQPPDPFEMEGREKLMASPALHIPVKPFCYLFGCGV